MLLDFQFRYANVNKKLLCLLLIHSEKMRFSCEKDNLYRHRTLIFENRLLVCYLFGISIFKNSENLSLNKILCLIKDKMRLLGE